MKTEEYIDYNKKFWNERVSFHKESEFYGLENFKLGKNKLHSLERGELGEVKGKSILHLQCHFGMDTLSLARLGADVIGVDFSDEAMDFLVKQAPLGRIADPDDIAEGAVFLLSDSARHITGEILDINGGLLMD